MTDQSTTSSAEPAINMNTNMNTNISSGDRYTMEEIVPLSLSSQEHKLHVHGANGNESLFSDIEEAPQNSYQYGHTPNHDTFLSSYLPAKYLDRLYPTNVPRSVQLLRQENIAIPACYLCVGILQGLSGPFINVYPLFLGATEAQQTTISSIRSLPASFKIFERNKHCTGRKKANRGPDPKILDHNLSFEIFIPIPCLLNKCITKYDFLANPSGHSAALTKIRTTNWYKDDNAMAFVRGQCWLKLEGKVKSCNYFKTHFEID
jgi:hypothetical protein